MRLVISFAVLLTVTPFLLGQQAIKEERRFGVLLTTELYSQESPKQTMMALVRALDKERYDYLVAHLLDPAYVEEQLQTTAAQFEQLAREQVAREGLEKKGFDPEYVRNRVRQLANQENFANLVQRVKTKLENDPEAVKELRQLAREGEIAGDGNIVSVKHQDIKGHTLFLRKVLGRWYLQNKML